MIESMLPMDLSPDERPPAQRFERIYGDSGAPETPGITRKVMNECDLFLKVKEGRNDKRTHSEADLSLTEENGDKRPKVKGPIKNATLVLEEERTVDWQEGQIRTENREGQEREQNKEKEPQQKESGDKSTSDVE